MTACCTEEAARLFDILGAHSTLLVRSGHVVEPNTLLLEADGCAEVLHQAWKVAQTLMESTSGIASATHAMCEAVKNAGLQTPIACTRKNFPGTKELAIKSVKAGGGTIHRLGLSETILIFPEHLMFVKQNPADVVSNLRRSLPEKKVVVEVKDVNAALRWANAGADVLQFDKFTAEPFKDCLTQISKTVSGSLPIFAAAGGVNLHNAAEYAQAGANLLVTSFPYFAPPADVQANFYSLATGH